MRPPVTPIFPRSNGPIVPKNLPIRKTDPREHILSSGGFHSRFNPEVEHSVHNNYPYANNPYANNPYANNPYANNNQSQPTIISCISIAQHIDSCPICSRLYDTDKTLYILAIIGLLILCFLMVKRIVKL